MSSSDTQVLDGNIARAGKRIVEALLLLAAVGLLIPPIGSNDPAEYVAQLDGVVIGTVAFFGSRLLAHGLRPAAIMFSALEAAGFFALGYILRQAILAIG